MKLAFILPALMFCAVVNAAATTQPAQGPKKYPISVGMSEADIPRVFKDTCSTGDLDSDVKVLVAYETLPVELGKPQVTITWFACVQNGKIFAITSRKTAHHEDSVPVTPRNHR